MAEPHASYDALVALALDDAEERDHGVLQHLSRCPSCRGRYDEVVAGVEQVLTATPRIDPPPGFDRAVLTAMGMTPGSVHRPMHRRRRWRAPWHRASLVLAAVVLGVLLGVGGMLGWTALDGTDDSAGGAADATLDTAAGQTVGTVTRSFLEGEPVLVVRVDRGVVGKQYECVVVLEDGRTQPAGSWVMESPRATWVVRVPPTGVDAVRLVTGEGRLWSAADLSDAG